ncbi:MAG: formate dehydrogenase subunit alpha [Chloroflexota bacterium]
MTETVSEQKPAVISVSIDGKSVEVPEDVTILDAARKAGVYVPTLCHHPALAPYGGCRMCIVQVEGMRGFPTSCSTPVTSKMAVKTNTPELQELRRNIFELVLSEHPWQCTSCVKNMRCELQQVATYIGLDKVSLPSVGKDLPVLTDSPFFDRDYKLCILCGRCVRMCQEVRGAAAIAFTYRGGDSLVGTAFGQTLQDADCQFCGACVDACPTGALMDRAAKPVRSVDRRVITTCPYCGVGCQLLLSVKDGRIVYSEAAAGMAPNNGQLCVKGKYGIPEFVHHPERLTRPLIRKDGKLVESSWDEALSLVAARLSQYKGDQFGFVTSAKCTNEENYVAQKFARVVMGTNNVDHCARLCHASTVAGLAQSFGSGAMTNSISEIGDASCVVVIGSNTTEAHPVIGLEVKRAVRRGAKLIVINPLEIALCRSADLWLRHKPGSDVALVMGMARAILEQGLADMDFVAQRCENFEAFKESLADFDLDTVEKVSGVSKEHIVEAARMYAANGPASILYTMGITQSSHGTDNVLAIANLAMMTGNVGKPSSGVNPLRGQNNVQGACDMGALPNVYSGYQSVADPAIAAKFETAWGGKMSTKPGLTMTEMVGAIDRGEIKALYIMGENPVVADADATHVAKALEKLEFFVAQDIFLTETSRLAHVVLPAASFAEKDGTFTNTERRVQRVRKAVEPPGEARTDWSIVCSVASRMGASGFDFLTAEEIMNEIGELTPSYGGISYNRLESGGLQWPCPMKEHPGTPILHRTAFTRGKGKFFPLKYRPPMEAPDKDYPLVLTTGRSLFHYHTGTMTRKVAGLNQIEPGGTVEIHPADAEALGIANGEMVKVKSRRGEVRTKAKVTEAAAPGLVFMTFHFAESSANVLTNAALDPVCKIPEFKVSAVKIEKA